MMSDLVKRLQDPPFGTDTSELLLMKSAADHIEALEAAIDKLLEVHTRIMGDTHWRTNDNTLWSDACDAGDIARTAREGTK